MTIGRLDKAAHSEPRSPAISRALILAVAQTMLAWVSNKDCWQQVGSWPTCGSQRLLKIYDLILFAAMCSVVFYIEEHTLPLNVQSWCQIAGNSERKPCIGLPKAHFLMVHSMLLPPLVQGLQVLICQMALSWYIRPSGCGHPSQPLMPSLTILFTVRK